jgi:hypothetical protein
MRSFFLGLFLALLSFVSALSAAGSKLLVVVDDEADKGKYSTFWSDLQCKSFTAIPLCLTNTQLINRQHSTRLPNHLPRRQRRSTVPLRARRARLLPPSHPTHQVKGPWTGTPAQPRRRLRQCGLQRSSRFVGRELRSLLHQQPFVRIGRSAPARQDELGGGPLQLRLSERR